MESSNFSIMLLSKSSANLKSAKKVCEMGTKSLKISKKIKLHTPKWERLKDLNKISTNGSLLLDVGLVQKMESIFLFPPYNVLMIA